MDIKVKKHLILLNIGILLTLFMTDKVDLGFVAIYQFIRRYFFPLEIIEYGTMFYHFTEFMYFLNNITSVIGVIIFFTSLISLLIRSRKI